MTDTLDTVAQNIAKALLEATAPTSVLIANMDAPDNNAISTKYHTKWSHGDLTIERDGTLYGLCDLEVFRAPSREDGGRITLGTWPGTVRISMTGAGYEPDWDIEHKPAKGHWLLGIMVRMGASTYASSTPIGRIG